LLDAKDGPNWVTHQGTSINDFRIKSFNLLDKTGNSFMFFTPKHAFRLDLSSIHNHKAVILQENLVPNVGHTAALT